MLPLFGWSGAGPAGCGAGELEGGAVLPLFGWCPGSGCSGSAPRDVGRVSWRVVLCCPCSGGLGLAWGMWGG